MRPLVIASLLSALAFATGCKTGNSGSAKVRHYEWASLDAELPDGSTATPQHSMSRYDYPFDSQGRYVSSWAAEGERRKGRSASSSSRSSSRKSSSSSGGYRYHKVRSGDTRWGLSRKYGTSVSAIKRANGLKSDVIVNGRTLKIPR